MPGGIAHLGGPLSTPRYGYASFHHDPSVERSLSTGLGTIAALKAYSAAFIAPDTSKRRAMNGLFRRCFGNGQATAAAPTMRPKSARGHPRRLGIGRESAYPPKPDIVPASFIRRDVPVGDISALLT